VEDGGDVNARRRLATTIAVGASALMVAVAPFALMLLPNPGAIRVSDPSAAGPGAYVGGRSEYYRLFPYAASPATFPDAAPVVRPDSAVLLITSTREDPGRVVLRLLPVGAAIPLRGAAQPTRTMVLLPRDPLPEGEYELTAPRGGLSGGTDTYYFRVAPVQRAARVVTGASLSIATTTPPSPASSPAANRADTP
jgi:hypothetical protein